LEKNNKEIRFFFTSDKNCDEERIKTTRSHEVMLTITKLRIPEIKKKKQVFQKFRLLKET
jgi:hypothetical protein